LRWRVMFLMLTMLPRKSLWCFSSMVYISYININYGASWNI
jgi:hypothetical protein